MRPTMDGRWISTVTAIDHIRIPRILAAVYGSVWAIQPATLKAIQHLVDRAATHRMTGDAPRVMRASIMDAMGTSGSEDELPITRAGTAILTIDGIIGQHLSNLEAECGGFDVSTLMDDLDAIESNSDINQVLMVLRSPGGVVTGVPEAADLRTTGGLVIGTDVQAWDADLDDLADGSLSGSKISLIYSEGPK